MGLLDAILGGAFGNAMGGQARSSPAPTGSGPGALASLLPVVLAMLASRSSGSQGGGAPGDMLRGRQDGNIGDSLVDLLGGMMGSQSSGAAGLGGLGSILEKFQQAGMGEQVKSWVGTGQNLPISPDAIGQVFGGDALSKIARQAGLSEQHASQGLSQLLPEVVDHLTPDGQLPDLSQLGASVDALRQRLGV